MKEYVTAIVLSAGRGTRMNSRIKKQYMELNGRPVIYYALKTFEESPVDEVVLVTGEEELEWVKEEIIEKYGFKKIRHILPGGEERYISVYQGLKAAENSDIVLIHDGARPFVTGDIIRRSIEGARQYGGVIAAVPVKDTVKQVSRKGEIESTPLRSSLYMAQTPQSFSYGLIRDAYDKMMIEPIETITDDSMILEYYGEHKVRIVDGSYRNIKITTLEDLSLGEIFLSEIENGY